MNFSQQIFNGSVYIVPNLKFHVITANDVCHGPVTVHSRSTHGTLTAQSRPTHGTLTAHSRHTHGSLTAHSRHTHDTLTAHSRPTHGPLTAQSRHSHGPLTGTLYYIMPCAYAASMFDLLIIWSHDKQLVPWRFEVCNFTYNMTKISYTHMVRYRLP